MERRYQVFVSSTYDDLREERAKVTEALLQLDCFPAGMELFPAADEDSWSLIKQVIDDSDYYLVILAGRYGSLKPGATKSFTQLEYEYALETGKPTIALLHGDPGQLATAKTEPSDGGRGALEAFRAELQKKNCRLWNDNSQLVAAVFTGIQHLKKSRPAVGWIKGSEALDTSLKDELIQLRRQSEVWKNELDETRKRLVPAEADDLAQGVEEVSIRIDVVGPTKVHSLSETFTWREVLRAILPNTFGGGAGEDRIAGVLVGLVRARAGGIEGTTSVSASDFGLVMNQMVALGLIEAKPHPANPGATIWVATPHGAQAGARMLAVKR